MNPTDHFRVPRPFCRLKTKSKQFGLLGPHFATIAKFQWFSKAPSPLNGMVWGNHWVQWFFNGFGVRQPLVSMVFDGCPPLVRRWNGCIPSLKSRRDLLTDRQPRTSLLDVQIETYIEELLLDQCTVGWTFLWYGPS